MFGFRNFTGRAFIGKVVNVIFQFFLGVVEEIIFNITQASATNAAEIPENFNLKLLLQDEIVTSTSLVVSSKLLQSNVVGIIAGATPNLFRETDLVSVYLHF